MSFGKNFLKEVGSIVGVAAPGIATAMGGPLAGMAVQAVAGALLGDEAVTDEQQILAAVRQAKPTDLVELKRVELEFQARLEEAGVKLEQVAAGDRDSARIRQVKMRDWTPSVLGAAIVLGFFGILGALLFVPIPEGAQDIFKILLGSLGAMTVQVGNYFFGSSAGSKRKNDMITQMKAAEK